MGSDSDLRRRSRQVRFTPHGNQISDIAVSPRWAQEATSQPAIRSARRRVAECLSAELSRGLSVVRIADFARADLSTSVLSLALFALLLSSRLRRFGGKLA